MHVSEPECLSMNNLALCWLEYSGEKGYKRALSGSVGPYNANAITGWKFKIKIFDQPFIWGKSKTNIMAFENFGAEAFHVNLDRNGVLIKYACRSSLDMFEIVDTGLVFCCASLWHSADPFQFLLQQLACLFLGHLLVFRQQRFLFQIIRIVALKRTQLPPIQFDDLIAHTIQEIAVVGHRQKGTIGLQQISLKPFDHFHIQVIGRFIQHQDIGPGQDDHGQGQAFLLPTGQLCDGLFKIMQMQLMQGLQDNGLDVPGVVIIHADGGLLQRVGIIGQ